MYLSKLLILTCILWMSGAQGSLIPEAVEPVRKKSPAPRQNDPGTDISSFKYGILLANNILQDCKQLKTVLGSIADPETGKNREEEISFLWERAVLNNVILADSIRNNPAKYEATKDEAKELSAALETVNQQLKDTLNQLRDLQRRNLLENEFELMLETKRSILEGHLDKHKAYLSDQDITSAFEKNKGYPCLLQGFFAMYREKDTDAAEALFREGARKGSREAQLMEALSAHPGPRKIMDGILEILPRLNAAAARITDQNTAEADEKDLVSLFDSLGFQISLLNRSSLSEEESEYMLQTWAPAYQKLMQQFHQEWSRIKSSQYFGNKHLGKAISGKSVSLNVSINLKTLLELQPES